LHESCKHHHIRIDIPYLEKRTLRGRYSNSLVIDAGSQFSLRACSQASRTVLFKLPYSSYSDLETVNFFCSFETTQNMNKPFKKIYYPLTCFRVFLKINKKKACINSNVSVSVNNERKLTCNISKSKLAFPLFNESYSSLIASLALKLLWLRIKPKYFFLGHPVVYLSV
jgi:hypothetical protein